MREVECAQFKPKARSANDLGFSVRKYSPKAWNLEELVWRGLEEFSNAGHHECLASPN